MHTHRPALQRLCDYLRENELLLCDVFVEFDSERRGRLDLCELQQLVAMIPGLDPATEQKFIVTFLYEVRDR